MTTRAKSNFGWVVLATFLLGLGSKVVATSMFVQDLATRMGFYEKDATTKAEDLKYIRSRVDEIYNRLPPANCGQCKEQ